VQLKPNRKAWMRRGSRCPLNNEISTYYDRDISLGRKLGKPYFFAIQNLNICWKFSIM
jgi:hypothetical protein